MNIQCQHFTICYRYISNSNPYWLCRRTKVTFYPPWNHFAPSVRPQWWTCTYSTVSWSTTLENLDLPLLNPLSTMRLYVKITFLVQLKSFIIINAYHCFWLQGNTLNYPCKHHLGILNTNIQRKRSWMLQ